MDQDCLECRSKFWLYTEDSYEQHVLNLVKIDIELNNWFQLIHTELKISSLFGIDLRITGLQEEDSYGACIRWSESGSWETLIWVSSPQPTPLTDDSQACGWRSCASRSSRAPFF